MCARIGDGITCKALGKLSIGARELKAAERFGIDHGFGLKDVKTSSEGMQEPWPDTNVMDGLRLPIGTKGQVLRSDGDAKCCLACVGLPHVHDCPGKPDALCHGGPGCISIRG